MLTNLALGRAGDLRVASELLIRGHDVFLTMVDSGADLVLGTGERVQVKSSHKTAFNRDKWTCHRYSFAFKSWKRTGKRYEAHKLADVDYVVLWAIDDNVFFVLPASEVRGKYTIAISISDRTYSRYLRFKDAWDILNHKQIER